MDDKQNTSNKTAREPYVKLPDQVVQNPNPKANENLRVRTDAPKTQNTKPSHGVGSEITDGEDA
jgi:hypothetical protein